MKRSRTWMPVLCAATLGCLVSGACRSKQAGVASDAGFQQKTHAALILAKPGSVVALPEGKFPLASTLSLTVDHVTVRGKGMDKTILSFEGQKSGASGMLVTANGFALEDLAIEGTAGDAVKVTGGDGLTVRRVTAEDSRICIQNNGPATFLNFDARGNYRHFSRDLGRYNCALPELDPVTLSAAL